MLVERPRRWAERDVCWGSTYCEVPGCDLPADGLWEHAHGAGLPLCVEHADLLLERVQAIGEAPQLAAVLPALFAEPRRSPARLSDAELYGRSPERWLAEQGFYGDPVNTEADPDWDIPF